MFKSGILDCRSLFPHFSRNLFYSFFLFAILFEELSRETSVLICWIVVFSSLLWKGSLLLLLERFVTEPAIYNFVIILWLTPNYEDVRLTDFVSTIFEVLLLLYGLLLCGYYFIWDCGAWSNWVPILLMSFIFKSTT